MKRPNQKQMKIIKLLCCVLTLLLAIGWLGFIFSNSLKSGEESGEQSSKVYETVNQIAQSVGIQQEITHETIRNTAHFGEFAVLALLVCLCLAAFWWLFSKRFSYALGAWSALSIPLCFLLAICDELLQTLSEDRATEFADVLLDTAGASLGTAGFALAVILIVGIQKNAKKHKI